MLLCPACPCRYLEGLAEAVQRHGGKIYEGTKAWKAGEERARTRARPRPASVRAMYPPLMGSQTFFHGPPAPAPAPFTPRRG